MSEPTGLLSKNNDEEIRNEFNDIVAETQAETNKLIAQKYNTLKSLKNQMTQLKRQFNGNVLTMQQDKREKCRLLSMRIEQFRRNYKALHPNGRFNEKMDIEEYAETIQSFDGISFQVKTTNFSPVAHLRTHPIILIIDYFVSRKQF